MIRFKPILVGILIFGSIFSFYFGIIFLVNSQEVAAYGDLDNWIETSAIVTFTYANYNPDSQVYDAFVEYNYTVNSDEFIRSSRIRIEFETLIGAEAHLNQHYQIGSEIVIYHHPDDPGFSSINPEKEIEFKKASFKFSRIMTYLSLIAVTISITSLGAMKFRNTI